MLVGIVTHDDAMDILRQEQTEDILAFGGVAATAEDDDEGNYWQGPVDVGVRRRIGWLLMLFLAGTITRWVIHSFDWVDKRFPEIEFDAFIPLLIGTGGNAGSQTVGTIIRGLALGQIQPGDTFGWSPARSLTGLVLGVLLGTIGFLFAWLMLGQSPTSALVIALAILGICIWANGDRSPGPAAGPTVRSRPRPRLRPAHQHAGRYHRACSSSTRSPSCC